MEAIGDELEKRTKELTEQFKSEGLPEPTLRTMDEVSV
jgi:hypothetical protein